MRLLARDLVFAAFAACVLAGCSVAGTTTTGTNTSGTTTAGTTTAATGTAATRTGRTAHRRAAGADGQRSRATATGGGNLRLITEPDAGIAPFVSAIQRARHGVDLVMYELEDPQVDAALAADERRGVRVRVLLNGGYYGEGSSANDPAYDFLRARSVPVRWTPSYFALTHQKTMVVDGVAYIMSLNFTPRYYASDRDLAVVDTNAGDVAAIERTFRADWQDQRLAPPSGADLVWSPGSEPALLSLIKSATGQLDVYNEEMDDADIEQALEADARRGVRVRVTMTYSSEWKRAFAGLSAAGVEVRTYADDAPLYIHAKMILTGRAAFVGSQNFSYTSLHRNRELGIALSAPSIINSLRRTFDQDFAGARPFTGSG